ncbi:hypothetical protein JXJ21_05175 [candidate division KSB1 bacterium]|nr:hypothetical protein [candidate division KSB1 bacterium]
MKATLRKRSPQRFGLYLSVCIALWLPASAVAQSVYVPLNHWCYEFIERLETQKAIGDVFNGTRPISREEMATYISALIREADAGIKLSRVQRDQLEFLKVEFREELDSVLTNDRLPAKTRIAAYKKLKFIDKIFPDFLYRNNRNFLEWHNGGFNCYLDPLFLREADFATADTIDGTERVYQNSNGLTFWGNLGTHLGFYFNTRDTRESGTRSYPRKYVITREQLGFVNGYGTHIYHDETISYFMLKLPYFNLQLGKDLNVWGPGYHGNLALSDYATSYDQIKFQAKLWRIKFTSLTGFLRAYPEIYEIGERLERSLAAHRIEINLGRSLQIGLHETVIYGGRKLEPAYFNPLMFYRSAEHYLGDHDNVAMGFDIDWIPLKNWKIYGELFLDDITTSKLGTGFYGNKFAYLAGSFTTDFLGIPNLDLRTEYARIRPYVYSHKYPINTYQHFTTSLGHHSGPNSDDLYAEIRYRFSKAMVVTVSGEVQRWGENTDSINYGREMEIYRVKGDPEYIDTLSGIRNRRYIISSSMSYELFRECLLELHFIFARLNRQHEDSEPNEKIGNTCLKLRLAINY